MSYRSTSPDPPPKAQRTPTPDDDEREGWLEWARRHYLHYLDDDDESEGWREWTRRHYLNIPEKWKFIRLPDSWRSWDKQFEKYSALGGENAAKERIRARKDSDTPPPPDPPHRHRRRRKSPHPPYRHRRRRRSPDPPPKPPSPKFTRQDDRKRECEREFGCANFDKRCYYKNAMKYHPDKTYGFTAEERKMHLEKFKRLGQCKSELIDS